MITHHDKTPIRLLGGIVASRRRNAIKRRPFAKYVQQISIKHKINEHLLVHVWQSGGKQSIEIRYAKFREAVEGKKSINTSGLLRIVVSKDLVDDALQDENFPRCDMGIAIHNMDIIKQTNMDTRNSVWYHSKVWYVTQFVGKCYFDAMKVVRTTSTFFWVFSLYGTTLDPKAFCDVARAGCLSRRSSRNTGLDCPSNKRPACENC